MLCRAQLCHACCTSGHSRREVCRGLHPRTPRLGTPHHGASCAFNMSEGEQTLVAGDPGHAGADMDSEGATSVRVSMGHMS